MDINKIIETLEAYFPLSLQEGWDNSGLQISPENSSIKGILLSLDVGLPTVEEAVRKGCNLIIAHHPLIFSAVKKIYGDIYPYNVIHKAIKNGIGIYAFHTNLDIAKNGLNDFLCDLLELKNVDIIKNNPPLRIGCLPARMEFDNAVSHIQGKLNAECIKYVRGNDKIIEKIAVCSGSCADMIYEIDKESYDLFLTGDLKHHTAFFAKNSGINIVDATHFHTEKFAKYLLKETLNRAAVSVEIVISQEDYAPWEYKRR